MIEIKITGTPREVATQMRELMNSLAEDIKFWTSGETKFVPRHEPMPPGWKIDSPEARESLKTFVREECNDPISLGEEQPQKSKSGACPFCGKYSKTGGPVRMNHVNYCDKNPNRRVWPTAGHQNPGLRAYQDRARDQKSLQQKILPGLNASNGSSTTDEIRGGPGGRSGVLKLRRSMRETSNGEDAMDHIDHDEELPF